MSQAPSLARCCSSTCSAWAAVRRDEGGADHHPAWYLNVADSKELQFQVATQAFRATWREPKGAERASVWDFMVGVFPPYTGYQASTQREIPLVMLSAIEPIESFKQ